MMQVFAYLGSYHCDLESENNFASGNGPKPVENPEVKPGPEPVENPEVKPGPEPMENPEVKPGPEPMENPEEPGSCFHVMTSNGWTCDDGKIMRFHTDMHDPYMAGTTMEDVKGECCQQLANPGTGDVFDRDLPPLCIAHCYSENDPVDFCPSSCDTSQCTENSNPPKSWIDEYFAKGCNSCLDECDFGTDACPTDCDITRCTSSTLPTYEEAARYFNRGCKSGSEKLQCGGGMYVKRRNKPDESCRKCRAGKFSKSTQKRNRHCKKCGRNKYQY